MVESNVAQVLDKGNGFNDKGLLLYKLSNYYINFVRFYNKYKIRFQFHCKSSNIRFIY